MGVCECGCGQQFDGNSRNGLKRFLSDRHRTDFHSRARRAGAAVLRKRTGLAARKRRESTVERMGLEAIAAGTPDQFTRPGAKPAQDLRLELGRAALRLGLLTESTKRLETVSRELAAKRGQAAQARGAASEGVWDA